MHIVYLPAPATPTPGAVLTITGDEAKHAARVKRVEIGEPVRVLNGRGLVADARVHAVRKDTGVWLVDVAVVGIEEVARPAPALRVLSGVPKGERLEQMIDGLSQVGAASWQPLASARAVVDPREGKVERLRRICEESLKQCARAWLMEVGERVAFADALRTAPGHELVLADASGERSHPHGASNITLLIGPEGGLSPEELAQARAAGARVCAFGVHTMRVEVAAVVAAGILMESQAQARA